MARQKLKGIQEKFQKKSGVYKMTNIKSNDFYIGSSRNIYNRYYSHWHMLKNVDHPNSKIRNHASIFGKDTFIFEVLEYCDEKIMKDREQYYCDLLKPTYNAWPTVYSAKNRTYSEKQKKTLFKYHPIKNIEAFKEMHRKLWAERKKDPNYREKYLKHLDKTGTKHSEETIAKMKLDRKGKSKPDSMREKTKKRRLGTKWDPINRIWIKKEDCNGI